MGELVNVSVKVPEEMRKEMKKLDVNWGEYLRAAIAERIRREKAREAAKRLDEIQNRTARVPTKEIVKWIREEREKSLE